MEIGPRIYRNFDLGGPISRAICNVCVCVAGWLGSLRQPASHSPLVGCWLRREREVNHNSCAPKRECGCAPQCLNHPARCCTHDFTRAHAHQYMQGTRVTMNYSSASYLLCVAPRLFAAKVLPVPNPSAGSYQFLRVAA